MSTTNLIIDPRLCLEEVWKPVQGYVGLYEVSSYGRIKSLNRYIIQTNGKRQFVRERYRKLTFRKDGYVSVGLVKEGYVATVFVHQLVATAFLGIVPTGYEVNHIDLNKTNNKLSNLEVITHLDNVHHAWANGKGGGRKGS